MTLRSAVVALLTLAGVAPAADPSSLELVQTIVLKGKAGKLDHLALDADNVKYDPARAQTYVAHAEKALGVVDAKTFAVKADIQLPGAAEGFQVATGQPRLFLALPSPSQLVIIDPDKREVVGTHPI